MIAYFDCIFSFLLMLQLVDSKLHQNLSSSFAASFLQPNEYLKYFHSVETVEIIRFQSTRSNEWIEQIFVPIQIANVNEKLENISIYQYKLAPIQHKTSNQSSKEIKSALILCYDKIRLMVATNVSLAFSYFRRHNSILQQESAMNILLFNSATASIEEVSKFLIYLWMKHGLINVIAQIRNSQESNTIIYKPLEKNTCNNSNNQYGLIEIYQSFYQVILNCANYFSLFKKGLKNFHKFPLKLSIFERYPTATRKIPYVLNDSKIYAKISTSSKFYGLDGIILSELSLKLNFEIYNYREQNKLFYGGILKNGIATGSLGQIINRDIQLQGNARFIVWHSDKTITIDYTFPFMSDQICILVGKSKEIPKWMKIYKIFCSKLGYILIGVYLLGSISNHILQKITGDWTPDPYWEMYCIALGFSQKIFNNTLAKRLFLSSCMLSFIVFSTLFTASLVKEFSTRSFYPEINTLEQLNQNNIRILSSLNIFSIDDSNRLYQSLSKKVEDSWENVSSLSLAAQYNGKYAGIERLTDAQLKIQTNYLNNEDEMLPMLHIIPECPKTLYIGYILPKGSPFLPAINIVLHRLFEAGLIRKWYNDFAYAFVIESRLKRRRFSNKNGMGENRKSSSNKSRPFDMEDIQSAFYILLIGLVSSVIVFLFEIIIYYYYDKKK